MLGNLGIKEIIALAIVLLFLFGSKKLPELGRGMAQSIDEIRKAFRGQGEEEKKEQVGD